MSQPLTCVAVRVKCPACNDLVPIEIRAGVAVMADHGEPCIGSEQHPSLVVYLLQAYRIHVHHHFFGAVA